MASKTSYPSYMGVYKTKAEANKKVKDRKRYGYAHKIVPETVVYEGRKIKRYKVMESQRPSRHTWWNEHLPGESVAKYKARMKKRGIKAYTR
jgi:hypothetical protein